MDSVTDSHTQLPDKVFPKLPIDSLITKSNIFVLTMVLNGSSNGQQLRTAAIIIGVY